MGIRLVDLDPNWCDERDRKGVGLTFLCPVHRDHYLGVPFANPFDDKGPSAWARGLEGKGTGWHREGDTFDTLTLSPSIHVFDQDPDDPKKRKTHWHGFIVKGEVKG